MAATYMLRKHQATVAAAARPEAVAEREIHAEAARRASRDRLKRYPDLTPDNFEDADRFRVERLEYWKRKLAKAKAE